MTILARRFTIICLTFIIFALAMLIIVKSTARSSHAGIFEINAPCPHPAGRLCKTIF